MTIRIQHVLAYPPAQVWAVVGDPGRVDWVPGVESCAFDGQVRRFRMRGAGELAERILLRDAARRRLEYSVVESDPPLAQHHASIQVDAHPRGAVLEWQTTVQPAAVETFIERSMRAALVQLETVLAAAG